MSYLNGSKGVVYCKSRDQCEEMAQHLSCGFYHAGMDIEDRTNRVMSIQASRDTRCNGTLALLEARIVFNALVYRHVQCAFTLQLALF